MKLFFLLLVPSISFANCSVSDALRVLRPTSGWTINGNDPDSLVWLDDSTQPPTKAEVVATMQACRSDASNRLALKQQAKLDVKNTLLTPLQRLQALLLLLDYDR